MTKQTSQIAAGCSGCGALLAMVLSCAATGSAVYFDEVVGDWENIRWEDGTRGSDPVVLDIDDAIIRDNQQASYASAGTAACAGIVALLGVVGTVGFFVRSRQAEG